MSFFSDRAFVGCYYLRPWRSQDFSRAGLQDLFLATLPPPPSSAKHYWETQLDRNGRNRGFFFSPFLSPKRQSVRCFSAEVREVLFPVIYSSFSGPEMETQIVPGEVCRPLKTPLFFPFPPRPSAGFRRSTP